MSNLTFAAEKLLLYPEEVRAILDGRDFGPVQIELSPTSRCNLSCVWCVDRDWRQAFPGDLDLTVFERVLTELRPRARGIVIEGGGEPLVYDGFRELVHLCEGFDLGLTTNGIRLHEYADLLPRFRWVRVSLDAYESRAYRRLKGADAWQTVMDNVRDLAAGVRSFGVSFLTSPTQCDPSAIYALARSLFPWGVSYFQIKRIVDHPDLDIGPLQPRFGAPPDTRIILQSDEDSVTGNLGLPCYSHPFSVQIAGSLDVFLCCRLRKKSNGWLGHLGNLREDSFSRIWNGPRRQRLRRALLDGRYCERVCDACRFTPRNALIVSALEAQEQGAFM